MSKEVFFKDENGCLEFDLEHEYLFASWKGTLSLEQAQFGAMKKLEIIQMKGTRRLMIDQSHIIGTWVHAKEWLLRTWMPQVVSAGLKRLAFIYATDMFGQLSLQLFMEKASGIECNAFSSIEEAEAWLIQNEENAAYPVSKETVIKENTEAISALNRLMEIEDTYREPALDLSALARRLDLPTRQLTEIVNTVFNKSFSDYVNAYRVDEVKRRLKAGDDDQLSLLALGLEAGFNSKATFNRIFKKHTGLSPNQFKAIAHS